MQGILFDLDGTLVNTLSDLADAMNRALVKNGLPPYPEERYRYFVGNGIHILTERVAGAWPEKMADVEKTYEADYAAHWHVRSAPYPGIPEMLEGLKQRGYRLCVFSNKPDRDTQNVIRYFFGEESFHVVRGQIEGIPIKPDPQGALLCAEALGVSPEHMLYLGDSGVDMRCAGNAGMTGIGALWGFREEQELREGGARYIVSSPQELLTLVDEL